MHLRSGVNNNTFFEDIVRYKGESEWVEIDSDRISYYLADHQDQIDTIDVKQILNGLLLQRFVISQDLEIRLTI